VIVLSKVVFPVYVPKCLKGTNARRKQQLAFKESENPATTAKRDHASQNVNLHVREREPQEINEVDNTSFVDLRNSSSAERLRHSEEIGQKIYMKEKQLNVQSKVHLYVGRLFGETILKLLQYYQNSNRKSGYMRVYRSHLVRCGWIRESEDMGIFCLMQLAMAMCLNLCNATSPDESTCCDGVCNADCTNTFTVYYCVFTDEDNFFTCEDLDQLFPARLHDTDNYFIPATTLAAVSDWHETSELNVRSMTNKPAGTMAWLFACKDCKSVKPYFQKQTEKVMKYGLSCRCLNNCKERPKPWKTDRLGEVMPSARFAPTQHHFQKVITL